MAGRRYGVETSICPSPVCKCERVRLRCFPETTEQSPHPSVPVCLEMDLEQCEIANFEELNSDPKSIRLAKAIANEISKADWNKLRSFYLGVKQYLTEHTDPDQIDADFPPDVLAGDGSMVGYYEILPYAKPVEFTLGAQTWLLDDQHCVRAKCSCQEAALSFFELRPSAQPRGIGSEPTLCIRYAYDTDKSNRFQGQRGDGGPGRILSMRLRSPTGFRFRLGQAPSPVTAIVSLRPKPEDNPVADTQAWSKRALSLWQRQKVQKVLRCLTSKSSPPNPLTLLVPQMAPGDTTVGSTP